MKLKDVKLDGEYLINVSGEPVRVRLSASVRGSVKDGRVTPTKFRCTRVDNGKDLPKLRAAAALRLP